MSGDYTRFTFNPAKGFSGVHKQQGRVSLDSDFNEFEEILDRRSRAEMYDVVGQAVVPLTTPNGFEIDVNTGGKLTIGVGRAYVDGILAECFGAGTSVRDDQLGGVHGQDPVVYEQQPFFYQPNFPVLSTTAGAINLVYLDVWQREVTVFEDESLREPALNGPDTATRVQTAWQVKVMQGANASSCATPPPAWTTLTAPSTARLSTQAAALPPAAGPCIINPAGGYTGLENRLYRVEIHKAGTLGGPNKAQFKWSRDNASLTARVLSITTVSGKSTITVSSTGRDSWMRFEQDDHVELLDDFVELAMRETGTGGPMARVLTVNHATGEIHVDQDLSAFVVVAARHPRIRRWDIDKDALPLPPVREVNNGVPIALEAGISITFGGAATDTLHAGDHWVFAARTADGTIETLVNAPPRGILHHFSKLALVTSGTPPTRLSDCRHFWPPACCCCTVEVGDGVTSHGEFNDIAKAYAAAVSRVSDEGITIRICILPGTHRVRQTITFNRPNITVSGCGRSSRISGMDSGPIFEVLGGWFRLEHLYLLSDSSLGPLVRVGGVGEVRIENNIFESWNGFLLSCERTFNSLIFRNAFWGTRAIRTQGWGLVIAQNRFFSRGGGAGTENTGMIELEGSGDQTWAAWILENQISRGPGHGILLSQGTGPLYDIMIAGNQIREMRGSGIATLHFSGPSGSGISGFPPQPSGTTPVYIYGLRIEHNTIEGCASPNPWPRTAEGVPQGGIVIGGVEHLLIADNRIVDNGANQPPAVPIAGIYIGLGRGLIIRDNVLTGNGRQGGKVQRVEGGIVALDLVVPMELSSGGFDTNVATARDVAIFDDPGPRPDGWPAAMVHGNLVVSPSGRALTLMGMGPMQVTDNRLISRQFIPAPISDPTVYTGAVLIQSSASPAGTTFDWNPTHGFGSINVILNTDGNVLFSDNDVVLDEATIESAGPPRPSPSTEAVAVSYAVMIKATNDLAFQDNVVRCLKGALVFLSSNTFIQGATTRAVGNGVYEDGPLSHFSSLYVGRPIDTEFCMVTNNQVSHCITIYKPGDQPKVIRTPNQEIGCQTSSSPANTLLPDLETSRRAMLTRITNLTQFEVKSLKESRAALSNVGGPEDPNVRRIEGRIRGAERLQEALEVDTRMSDRAKQIEPGDWALLGRVLDAKGQPIAGARLELQEGGRSLTEIKVDEKGEIFAYFGEKTFKDLLQRAPQLKVVVKAADGKVLQTLEQTLTPTADRVERFELRIGETSAPATKAEPASEKEPRKPEPSASKAVSAPEGAAQPRKKTKKARPRSGPRKKS